VVSVGLGDVGEGAPVVVEPPSSGALPHAARTRPATPMPAMAPIVLRTWNLLERMENGRMKTSSGSNPSLGHRSVWSLRPDRSEWTEQTLLTCWVLSTTATPPR